MNAPVMVELDEPRRIRWTKMAGARMSRLGYSFADAIKDLSNRNRFTYALCVIIWSALVELDTPYREPEQIAEALDTEEKIADALSAISAMLDEAGLSKESKKNGGSGGNGSSAGPAPSSSSAPPAHSTASSPTKRSEPFLEPGKSGSTAPTLESPGSSPDRPESRSAS